MNLYVQKPCEAIQLNKQNIQNIMEFFPDNRFVFFGIEMLNGKEQKVFDEDLSSFPKVGGFLYYNRETKVILENDWIIKRNESFEVISNDYFIANYVQIPFISTENLQEQKIEVN